MLKSTIAHQLVAVCRNLYAHGFVTASDGNVSSRLPNGNILATPTSLNKGRVVESDLVEVTLDGAMIHEGRAPSTELGMHLYIYRQRPDVNAVVHAHPTYATGFATAHIPLDKPLLPEVIIGLGPIPLAIFAVTSTQEVADSIAPYVQSSSAILLANHGVVTFGKDLDDAYFKMEKVEHAARITFVARMLGGEKVLAGEQVKRLKETFNKKKRS
ncbi:MAG: class II aldolase/adducin family protein [Ignavibacteriales bacterium]|nr:class II aldolase/adducin family protein [Ignavibacteriales bacterium]